MAQHNGLVGRFTKGGGWDDLLVFLRPHPSFKAKWRTPVHSHSTSTPTVFLNSEELKRGELEKKRMGHAQYAERLRALTTPVRRLPDDILLTILFESLGSAEPWSTPHPSVVASYVCRRWRGLALGTPLLWTKIEIRFILGWSLEQEIRPYIKPYLSLCRRSLRSVAERVRTFAQRSSGCPLQLQGIVYDHPYLRPRSSVDVWGEKFEPLAEVISNPTIRWQNITLDLGVSTDSSLALHFLRMPVASSGLGMQNATLRVHASSPVPEARWNAVLPEGKIDLRLAKLRSFSKTQSEWRTRICAAFRPLGMA
ncbi:hypothetical protein FA13DRAFT_1720613 [Coprinellus micaceus]|uniref:Uncharacterized protein n=1 Tax=Coprinellus micaceus TaxID=71717 RepID=A0A4Y7S7P3_COPMI|nr:hypothetical protein FA13DRAFT_1720613 [Coprinellus micaceus]